MLEARKKAEIALFLELLSPFLQKKTNKQTNNKTKKNKNKKKTTKNKTNKQKHQQKTHKKTTRKNPCVNISQSNHVIKHFEIQE